MTATSFEVYIFDSTLKLCLESLDLRDFRPPVFSFIHLTTRSMVLACLWCSGLFLLYVCQELGEEILSKALQRR